MRKIFKSLLCITIILLTFCSCSLKTPEEYYALSDIENGISVSVAIDCSLILENMDKLESGLESYVPANGEIISQTKIVLNKDSSAFDALREVCRQNKIHLEYTGSDSDIYIEGIANIYEFSCGPLSGWEYRVNGEFYPLGCNNVKLSEGDTVEFIYTCDLGNDIGNEFVG